MKIKRLVSFGPSLLLSFSALLVIAVPKVAAATVAWDGEGADENFSTAANWVGDVVPSNGDSLVFDGTGMDANAELTNDLASASFASITVQDDTNITLTGNQVTLTGGVTLTSTSIGSYLGFDIPVVISGDQTFALAAPSIVGVTGSGSLSGSGNITVTGGGQLNLFSDSSSYTGTLTVNSSVLWVYSGVNNALGATSGGTVINSGSTLHFCAYHSVSIAEPITVSGTGYDSATFPYDGAFYLGSCGGTGAEDHTVTLTGATTLGANTEVSGSHNNKLKITGPLAGAYTIKVASGSNTALEVQSSNNTSLTPNGTSTAEPKTTTYAANSPSTNIVIGFNETAVVTGTYGQVIFSGGGTLKGTGTVGIVYLDNGSTIAPGLSPGCMNTGNLTFVSGSTYDFEVGGTTECSGYDRINVTGTVDLGSGTLNTDIVNDFKPAKDNSFMIISNDGADAVTGTFDGLAQGATFTVDGAVFAISYTGGDGNDVVLTVQSVPAAPNTGFKLVTANPLVTFLVTTVAAGAIALIARRSKRFAK